MAIPELSPLLKAKQQYDIGFHLLKVSYPMLKDPKVLVGVVHNLLHSAEESMDTILTYDRKKMLIPAYPTNFHGRFDVFQRRSAPRYKIPVEISSALLKMKEITQDQQKSPVEFSRDKNFVLCSKDYKTRVISSQEVQEFLEKTKQLLDLTQQIITSHERKE
ncbi:hypothetical protein HYX12_03920 [Candidatus Woesearchaeota archaeon]|nr:hypothetical protein [Candidatus Woesearchaeota archaeon]